MPAIVTKDLSIVIYGRSGPRSLKQFFTSQYNKNPDANRLTGLYELVLKRASDIGMLRKVGLAIFQAFPDSIKIRN